MNYERIYENLIQRARTRVPPEGYIERHHVVPKCLGGLDDDSNLVALTPEEHYVAHQLLVKMYPKERGLIYAANSMASNHSGRKNKRYGWLKRKYAKQRSIDSKGKGNSQYGTIWVNKIGTTENKKIPKGETIPDGWQGGRVMNPSLYVCDYCGCFVKIGESKCPEHKEERRSWYNNGISNGKFYNNQVPLGWVIGVTNSSKDNMSKSAKTSKNKSKGTFWVNNGFVNRRMVAIEEGWVKGRI